MLLGFAVTFARWLATELADLVRPLLLGTHALFNDRFDALANSRAVIGIDGTFHPALVVINEKARRPESLRRLLFDLIELDRCTYSVRGATVEFALAVNRRAIFAEIDPRRQRTARFPGRCVELVPVIRKVRDPTIPDAVLTDHRRPLGQLFSSVVFCHEQKSVERNCSVLVRPL